MIDAVWGRNFTLILIVCCSNTPRWRLCVDIRWFNIWDGFCVDPGRAERTSVCLNLNVLLVFNAVWGRNLTLMRCFVVKIHYNVDDGSALISVGWIYGTGAVLDKQTVRFHYCACALQLERIIIGVWPSMLWGHNLTPMCCPNTLHDNGDYGSALIFVG